MKTPRSLRSGFAFTLIELLVVITIIAILASLTFTGVGTAMLAAKRVQAKNDMSQIAIGVTSYYTEYGKYPAGTAYLTGTSDVAYGNSSNVGNDQIINILRFNGTNSGVTDPNNQNPRQIPFLQPKVNTTAGTTLATKSQVNGASGKWYDPWGTQYIIFIDGDYAGDIDPTLAFTLYCTPTTRPSFGVGVASVGYYYANPSTNTAKIAQPDALPGARTYNKTTDLLSW